jgi:hypothetical protein
MTLPEAHTFFRNTFRHNLNGMLDGMLSWIMGKPVVDIGKFDDFLCERHPEYKESGLSMADVLRNNYGEEVLAKMKDLLEAVWK